MKSITFLATTAFLMAGVVFSAVRCVGDDSNSIRAQENLKPPPGKVPRDYTSLHCIGIRWFLEGKEFQGAGTEVAFREKGKKEWRPAMGLFPIPREALSRATKLPESTWLFAGSIFGLQADTEYEVKLTARTASGQEVGGVIRRRTWKEPVAPLPERTLHVIPGEGGGVGTREDPFKGIAAAESVARPGDLFLLGEGVYKAPARFTKDGAPGAPVIWRGPEKGEAVIQGDGVKGSCGIIAQGRKHIWFENIGIRKAYQAMAVDKSKFLVIRGCKLVAVDKGISGSSVAERFFIADNIIKGNVAWGTKPKYEARGIEVSGTGHVICYNYVSNFRDAIDTRGPHPVRDIDIYRNDCFELQDDGIELDYSEHNTRAYENRITNATMGISFQPVSGGPAYAIRNVMYNVAREAFKIHRHRSERRNWGGVMLHNTVVKQGEGFRVHTSTSCYNFYSRNNLFVGSPSSMSIDLIMRMNNVDFDYNDYVTEGLTLFARFDKGKYTTIEAFRKGTGQEKHGLSLTEFSGLLVPGHKLPPDSKKSMPVSANNPLLAPGSPVTDKGVLLPTINEDFKGKAPDIGAYEFGVEPPHYGPREK